MSPTAPFTHIRSSPVVSPTAVAVDEVIRQSGLPPALVQVIALELELAGRLERHAGGKVSLTAR